MDQVFLLLGSNLGERLAILQKAKVSIRLHAGEILAASSVYQTAPWGITDQPGFLNQVLEISTELSPEKLLAAISEIEKELGRIRHEKWGPRSIDIDILYYSASIVVTSTLKIPHPGIADRRFTLIPLVEIAPDYIHPVFNISNQELLYRCQDFSSVNRYDDIK